VHVPSFRRRHIFTNGSPGMTRVLSRIVTSSTKNARSVQGAAESVAKDPIEADGEALGEAIRLRVVACSAVRGVDVVLRIVAEGATSPGPVEEPPPAGLGEGWKLQLTTSHATAAAIAATSGDRPLGVILAHR